jgi:hypothetical protein
MCKACTEAAHCLVKDVPLLAQDSVPLRSLASSWRSSVVRPWRRRVDVGLANPFPDGDLGQVQVPGDLADRAVTPSAQLDDSSLEALNSGVKARRGRNCLFSMAASSPGQDPSWGCPSKWVKPIARRVVPVLPRGLPTDFLIRLDS